MSNICRVCLSANATVVKDIEDFVSIIKKIAQIDVSSLINFLQKILVKIISS